MYRDAHPHGVSQQLCMKHIFLYIILAGIGYILLTPYQPPITRQENQAVQVAVETPKPATVAPIAPEPVKPLPTYPAVGGAPSERVTAAVRFYQAKGVTNTGVAYLVGNFIGESHLDPNNYDGDGGLAHGIAQWHPSRRANGLPDTLEGQMEYAWQEIQRYPVLRDALFTHDTYALRNGIRIYEGYSIEGARFQHAQTLLQYLL
jgi:hypothetical protein